MIPLKRYKLKLNSLDKMTELLQETYNEACKNIEEAQSQINKLTSSVVLNDEAMDAKAKYAKAMNDFIVSKDKAIGRKLEIAKLMSEVYKYNGNVEKGSENVMSNIDLDELKSMLSDEDENGDDKSSSKEYNINTR